MRVRQYSGYIFADEVSLHIFVLAEKMYYYFILKFLKVLFLLLYGTVFPFFMLFDICQLSFIEDTSGQIQNLKFKKEGAKKKKNLLCFLNFITIFFFNV